LEAYRELDIASLAELKSVAIAELFPELAHLGETKIQHEMLDIRSANALRRQECYTWVDLSEFTIGGLWKIPNAGRLTVERILAAAREMTDRTVSSGAALNSPDTESTAQVPSVQQRAAGGFISLLAEWGADARGAVTVGDLLDLLNGPLPDDVGAALSNISSLYARDVLPIQQTNETYPSLISQFLLELGSGSNFLVERHISNPTGRAPTLESLAQDAGITRERVRQLIKRGTDTADDVRLSETFRLLRWRAVELNSALGTACPAVSEQAVVAIEHAARGFDDPDGCTAKEFFLWFAGEYREFDGWWVSGNAARLDSFKGDVQDLLESDWLLHRSQLQLAMETAGVVVELADQDLGLITGWRQIDLEWWVRWDGTVADKAERVLRLALRAIHPEEMNELVGDGHAVSSVQNVLSSDERFMRVSLELEYALTEWGWEEYSSTAQEIAERIERAGGATRLDDVVVELFDQFGLKESTVRAIASTPAFVIHDGVIRMRSVDEEIVVNDRIDAVQGLYVNPAGQVLWHLLVDHDVLRGSGRKLPNPVAVTLGVRPGGSFDFATNESGHVRITWPMTSNGGASIGSTRSLVEELAAEEGQTVRLMFDLVEQTVRGQIVTGSSLEALTGLEMTPGTEALALSEAIGVDATEVRATLSDRGDAQVAALLPKSRVSPGLDDALARLDDLLG